MAREVICLDTHSLLWWALDPAQLSSAAQDAVARMEHIGGIASSISIWELAIKVRRKKLELPISVDEFARRLERSSVVELVPVDTKLWLRSVELEWDHHDPADRVIVATALAASASLVTKDSAIRAFSGITSIW